MTKRAERANLLRVLRALTKQQVAAERDQPGAETFRALGLRPPATDELKELEAKRQKVLAELDAIKGKP